MAAEFMFPTILKIPKVLLSGPPPTMPRLAARKYRHDEIMHYQMHEYYNTEIKPYLTGSPDHNIKVFNALAHYNAFGLRVWAGRKKVGRQRRILVPESFWSAVGHLKTELKRMAAEYLGVDEWAPNQLLA